MTFKIEYYDEGGQHITLHPNGDIELYRTTDWFAEPLTISGMQSKILKDIIIAEYELNEKRKIGRR